MISRVQVASAVTLLIVASGGVALTDTSLASASTGATVARHDTAIARGQKTLFDDVAPVITADAADARAVELGVAFTPVRIGRVMAIRFFKGTGNTGRHTGTIWSSSGKKLASVTFRDETAEGWQTADLDRPLLVAPRTTYVASYQAPHGHYAYTKQFFSKPRTSGDLTAPADHNGRFVYGQGFPTETYEATNYFVDVVFSPGMPVAAHPPAVAPPAAAPTPTLTARKTTPSAAAKPPVHRKPSRPDQTRQPSRTRESSSAGHISVSPVTPTHASGPGAPTPSPTPSGHQAAGHHAPQQGSRHHNKADGHHSATRTCSSHGLWPWHWSWPIAMPAKVATPSRLAEKQRPTHRSDTHHGKREHGGQHEQEPAGRHNR